MEVCLRFCFSTYGQVLKQYTVKGVTQVSLGRTLLFVLNGDEGLHYSDSDISDLFNGKKDVSPSDLEKARKTETREMANLFETKVLPMIDENRLEELIASLTYIIEFDDSIKGSTTIDLVGDKSKELLLANGVDVKKDFLAGTYLYVVLKARNCGSQKDARRIREEGLPSRRKKFLGVTKDVGFDTSETSISILQCGNYSVNLLAGDLFAFAYDEEDEKYASENIVVIPVESTFCTHLSSPIDSFEGNFVSSNTIHGMFLKRWMDYGKSTQDLDKLIWHNLEIQYGVAGIADKRMPIGTIAAVPGRQCIYFLLAISKMDDKGIARCSEDDLENAVLSLLSFYDRYGQGNQIYMPLIGTGRSRANLTLQESFEKIIGLIKGNRENIHGDITIVALPEKIREIDVEGV